MKKLTCCFTGHREINDDDAAMLKSNLLNTVVALVNQGILYFGVGGALGFDMYAAETVIELKKTYPSIRLILVLPCRDYDKYWNDSQKSRYLIIKQNSDKIIYVGEKYHVGLMQKRNRHLVDHSSVCVAYVRKTTGGSAYTVKYALKNGLKLIYI